MYIRSKQYLLVLMIFFGITLVFSPAQVIAQSGGDLSYDIDNNLNITVVQLYDEYSPGIGGVQRLSMDIQFFETDARETSFFTLGYDISIGQSTDGSGTEASIISRFSQETLSEREDQGFKVEVLAYQFNSSSGGVYDFDSEATSLAIKRGFFMEGDVSDSFIFGVVLNVGLLGSEQVQFIGSADIPSFVYQENSVLETLGRIGEGLAIFEGFFLPGSLFVIIITLLVTIYNTFGRRIKDVLEKARPAIDQLQSAKESYDGIQDTKGTLSTFYQFRFQFETGLNIRLIMAGFIAMFATLFLTLLFGLDNLGVFGAINTLATFFIGLPVVAYQGLTIVTMLRDREVRRVAWQFMPIIHKIFFGLTAFLIVFTLVYLLTQTEGQLFFIIVALVVFPILVVFILVIFLSIFSGYYLSESITEWRVTAEAVSTRFGLPSSLLMKIAYMLGGLVFISLISRFLKFVGFFYIQSDLNTGLDRIIMPIGLEYIESELLGSNLSIYIFFLLFFIQPILSLISESNFSAPKNPDDRFYFMRIYKRLYLLFLTMLVFILSFYVSIFPNQQEVNISGLSNAHVISNFIDQSLLIVILMLFTGYIIGLFLSFPRAIYNVFAKKPWTMFPDYEENEDEFNLEDNAYTRQLELNRQKEEEKMMRQQMPAIPPPQFTPQNQQMPPVQQTLQGPKFCTKCGHPRSTEKFCTKCGYQF